MRICKKTLSLVLALMMTVALMPLTVLAETGAIRIMVDGAQVNTDVAPFIDDNGRTMVPVRFISEELDADVDWDGNTGTVTITLGTTKIELRIGSSILYKNGEGISMDTEAIIKDDRTFVPVRYIAQALLIGVGWDEDTRTVHLSTNDIHPFSTIVEYKGDIYSIYAKPEMPNFNGLSGYEGFVPLPQSIAEHLESFGETQYIYSFTIYKDVIYYVAAEPGSDVIYGSVYRCNLDGSNNSKLVSVVESYSSCVIVAGLLFYEFESATGDRYVTSLDLNGLMRQQTYDDFPVDIELASASYLGYCYYFSGDTLYRKDLQTKQESAIMTLVSDDTNMHGNNRVMAISYDTVYYCTSGMKGASGGAYLFGVDIHSGESKLLASWYIA